MEPLIPLESMSDRVAFSSDGRRVLSVAPGPVAEVRDVASGLLVSAFSVESGYPPHNDLMHAVALDACGRQALLVAAYSSRARIYDVERGQERLCLWFEGASSPIIAVGFSPDSALAFVGYRRRQVAVFECQTGRLVHHLRSSLPTPWPGKSFTHADLVCCLASRGERLLASFGDLAACEWNLTDGSEVATYTGHFQEIVGLALGSRRVWATQDGSVWEGGQCLWQASSHWHFAVFSQDGERLLVGSDRGLEAIDLGNGQCDLVTSETCGSALTVDFAPLGGLPLPEV